MFNNLIILNPSNNIVMLCLSIPIFVEEKSCCEQSMGLNKHIRVRLCFLNLSSNGVNYIMNPHHVHFRLLLQSLHWVIKVGSKSPTYDLLPAYSYIWGFLFAPLALTFNELIRRYEIK